MKWGVVMMMKGFQKTFNNLFPVSCLLVGETYFTVDERAHFA